MQIIDNMVISLPIQVLPRRRTYRFSSKDINRVLSMGSLRRCFRDGYQRAQPSIYHLRNRSMRKQTSLRWPPLARCTRGHPFLANRRVYNSLWTPNAVLQISTSIRQHRPYPSRVVPWAVRLQLAVCCRRPSPVHSLHWKTWRASRRVASEMWRAKSSLAGTGLGGVRHLWHLVSSFTILQFHLNSFSLPLRWATKREKLPEYENYVN